MPNSNVTDVIFLVDESGSMHDLRNDTIGGLNAYVQKQREAPGEAFLTVYKFSSGLGRTPQLLRYRENLRESKQFTSFDYMPSGGTALNDSACVAIDGMGAAYATMKEEERPGKVLFVIQTDGQENESRIFTIEDLRRRIQHQQSKYGWSFIFLGANIDAFATAQAYGIPIGTVSSYVADSFSTKGLYQSVSNATCRARGGGNVNFVADEYGAMNHGVVPDEVKGTTR